MASGERPEKKEEVSEEQIERDRTPHTPVLLKEVLEWLRIKPDGIYLDATTGAGGHSAGDGGVTGRRLAQQEACNR